MLRQLSSSFPRGAKRGAAHNGGARQALGPPLVQGSGGRDNSCELQSTAPTHPTQRSVAASCASTSTNTEVLHLLGMWPHTLTKKPWIGKPTCNLLDATAKPSCSVNYLVLFREGRNVVPLTPTLPLHHARPSGTALQISLSLTPVTGQ